MGVVSERYSPVVVGVNATVTTTGGNSIGGFLCVTSGVITLSNNAVLAGVPQPVTFFTNLPVTAGVYVPIPFVMRNGYTLVASGGASGVLGVV